MQSVSPQVEFCGLHAPVTGGRRPSRSLPSEKDLGAEVPWPGPSFKYPQEYVPLYLRSLPKKTGRWPQTWGKWQGERGLQLRQTSAPGQQVATGSSRWSTKALQPQVYLASPLWGTSAFLGLLGACRSHQPCGPLCHISAQGPPPPGSPSALPNHLRPLSRPGSL